MTMAVSVSPLKPAALPAIPRRPVQPPAGQDQQAFRAALYAHQRAVARVPAPVVARRGELAEPPGLQGADLGWPAAEWREQGRGESQSDERGRGGHDGRGGPPDPDPASSPEAARADEPLAKATPLLQHADAAVQAEAELLAQGLAKQLQGGPTAGEFELLMPGGARINAVFHQDAHRALVFLSSPQLKLEARLGASRRHIEQHLSQRCGKAVDLNLD
jgi:hypothetical protein